MVQHVCTVRASRLHGISASFCQVTTEWRRARSGEGGVAMLYESDSLLNRKRKYENTSSHFEVVEDVTNATTVTLAHPRSLIGEALERDCVQFCHRSICHGLHCRCSRYWMCVHMCLFPLFQFLVRNFARAVTSARIEPYLPPFLQKAPDHHPSPGINAVSDRGSLRGRHYTRTPK